MASRMYFFRTSGAVNGGAASLSPGYYWLGSLSGTAPAPTPANWTQSTTKFDDVAPGDETTFESNTGSNAATRYLHGLLVLASPLTGATIAYAAATHGISSGQAFRWDGAAYQSLFSADNWNHVAETWEHPSHDAVFASSSIFLLTIADQGSAFTSTANPKVGDWRFS